MKLPFFLARRFVAAENLDDTVPVLSDLKSKGLHTTLDLLGEYVRDRNVAAEARDIYLQLAERIADERDRHGVDANLSVKLSVMGQKIDEAFCLDNLRQLLSLAREKDVFVRLDMEGSDITESTLSIFESVYPDYPDHVGIVLQAYLKRTAHDVERMCELNARVRLCKGAYKEPASIAYQSMDEIRARFVDYMRTLISDSRYPGIATHDDRLIAATQQYVQENGVDRSGFEFQMLYGIRPDTQLQIADSGYNMRIYVPYGKQWVPYFSRRLRERKENVWFVLSNLFRR
ncbi:MAG: proline dehydrogenase family protein [Rhodothermales bacterium]|nr:proline dehydrogenase family protein [Rhodothermales bacterium]